MNTPIYEHWMRKWPTDKKVIKFQEKGSTAKKHFQISLIKSIIRIGACVVLCYGNYVGAGIGLGIAELLGIYEEIA